MLTLVVYSKRYVRIADHGEIERESLMKLRWMVLGLLCAGLLCAPLLVGCGPSFKSEESTTEQLKKEEVEESQEADVKAAPKPTDEGGEEADDEALTEPDIP